MPKAQSNASKKGPIGRMPVTVTKGGPKYNTSTGGGHSSSTANKQRKSGR